MKRFSEAYDAQNSSILPVEIRTIVAEILQTLPDLSSGQATPVTRTSLSYNLEEVEESLIHSNTCLTYLDGEDWMLLAFVL